MNRIYFVLLIIVTGGCSAGISKKQTPDADQKAIITTNAGGNGPEIIIEFHKGESFYYPLMAAWLEDEIGDYIQTLFVPASVATSIFKFGKMENNRWEAGPKRAPQTLPYWSHKRGIIASDGLYMPELENPVPDAYSGATPVQSFILNSRADKKLPVVFRVLFEVNQNWDWNEFWTNDKFPDDDNYRMSCQPAIVYEVIIDTRKSERTYSMKPVGYSHYSGKTGELFTDLSTLTTALNIAESITVTVK